MSRIKDRILYFLIDFSVIALVVFFFHFLLYELFNISKNASNTTIIIMAALCAKDYLTYWLRYRYPAISSDEVYPFIIRTGNTLRVIQWIKIQPSWILLLIALIWTVFANLSILIFDETLPDIMEDKSTILVIIVGLLVAPIIETLLFQVCIIELVKKITPKVDGRVNLLFPLLVSAIIFSLNHSYSASYVVYAFFLGIALSSLYILGSSKTGKTWKDGFLLTLLFHLGINAIAFVGYLVK